MSGGDDYPPPPGVADDQDIPHTWLETELAGYLDGTWESPVPTVGARDDGAALFYPGRVHLVASEAEAGKTWLALVNAAAEIMAGNHVTYIDFEDEPGGIAGRLFTLGVPAEIILERFAYLRPDSHVDLYENRADLAGVLARHKPALVILDGITEAMTLHGLDLRDNAHVATFSRLLPRWLAMRGPAVVCLDHVPKDPEGGGHAIGGVHKLNGVDVMYLLESRDAFGIGREGRSRLLIRKDRPGELRRLAIVAHDGLYWYADLVVDSTHAEFANASIPAATEAADKPFRPSGIMNAIVKALANAPAGLSGRAIDGAVKGKAETIRYALELLINEGRVRVEPKGRATIHILNAGPRDDDPGPPEPPEPDDEF